MVSKQTTGNQCDVSLWANIPEFNPRVAIRNIDIDTVKRELRANLAQAQDLDDESKRACLQNFYQHTRYKRDITIINWTIAHTFGGEGGQDQNLAKEFNLFALACKAIEFKNTQPAVSDLLNKLNQILTNLLKEGDSTEVKTAWLSAIDIAQNELNKLDNNDQYLKNILANLALIVLTGGVGLIPLAMYNFGESVLYHRRMGFFRFFEAPGSETIRNLEGSYCFPYQPPTISMDS